MPPPDFTQLTGAGQTRRLLTLARTALAEYDVPARSLVPLAKGWNTNVRVDDRYMLRIRSTDAAFAEAETTWLTALARDTDLAVPEPVPTRSGATVVTATTPTVPGPRTCVLYRWVDGRFRDRSLTPAHLHEVGVFTALLQQHGTTMPALARNRVDAVPADTAKLVTDLHSPAAGALVARTLARVDTTLAGLPATGLIHADLHQDNFLFHQGRVRAIDFDDCGYGPHLYDLATTISELGPDRPALHRALLTGYRTTSPLDDEDALPDLLLLRRLQLTMWAVTQRHDPMFRTTWRTQLDATLRHLAEVQRPKG
ncbi:phosphotransferase enzyme family protein [Umezawaea tangerina]|uniref:Ser/Thr protein kinase RdoA (MazF antagonist) n=1 Tax=Umezawaea tangerina TaxID=84725 RepID=A0A2T0TM49_9PSEU|nr:phosphotransferase [Umezawaea tangerina]PRY46729.1 Ser/Thr protein kinase RdoA (MazF antagonist) [Umezawaea tangerina]